MAALNFPDPALQTPVNVYGPTSTPAATTNGVTYTWDTAKWVTTGTSAEFVLKSGDTMTGTLVTKQVTSPQQTITAGAFDLAEGNFWTAGAISIPNPTNGVAGMSGLIVLLGAPTGWGANFDFPGGTPPTVTTVPAVIPFFVQDPGTILMGNVIEGIA